MSDVTTELAMEASDKAVEIARLQDENARLREQGARLFDKTLELATENSKLRELCKLCEREVENAKLRELVKEMRVCLEDECKRCHEWGDICDLEQRMRELGVEVAE